MNPFSNNNHCSKNIGNVEIECKSCFQNYSLVDLILKTMDANGFSKYYLSKQNSPKSDHEIIDSINFENFLEKIILKGGVTYHSKQKKIKKRGRKKWFSRHDLILEGAILLYGDNIDQIQLLLSEFNRNMITKKLNHVLWKKYSILPKINQNQGNECRFKEHSCLDQSLQAEKDKTTTLMKNNSSNDILSKIEKSLEGLCEKPMNKLKMEKNDTFCANLNQNFKIFNDNLKNSPIKIFPRPIEKGICGSMSDFGFIFNNENKQPILEKPFEKKFEQLYYQSSLIHVPSFEHLNE